MRALAKVLVGLAGLAFVLAVAAAYAGRIMGVHPEGYSRAASNLALLAIALVLTFDTSRANS
jgi:hypothetical protein